MRHRKKWDGLDRMDYHDPAPSNPGLGCPSAFGVSAGFGVAPSWAGLSLPVGTSSLFGQQDTEMKAFDVNVNYAQFCKRFPIYTDQTGHWYGWQLMGDGKQYPCFYRNAIKAGRRRKRYWLLHSKGP